MIYENLFTDLEALSGTLFNWLSMIIVFIFGNGLLTIFFAIFIVNRVSKLLQKIR